MNPLQSRRFCTLLLDVLISTVIYAVSTYGTPQAQEFAKVIIAIYQPVFLWLIGNYTADDISTNKALISVGDHPIQVAARAAPAPESKTGAE